MILKTNARILLNENNEPVLDMNYNDVVDKYWNMQEHNNDPEYIEITVSSGITLYGLPVKIRGEQC